jgi:hypothetical protein
MRPPSWLALLFLLLSLSLFCSPTFAGPILSFSLSGTVTLVSDSTNSNLASGISPISVGDQVFYSMTADYNSCGVGSLIYTWDAYYFCDPTAGSSVSLIFQTSAGAVTFESPGKVTIRVSDAALGAPSDLLSVDNYSADYPAPGSWSSSYLGLSDLGLSPANFVTGIGFPSTFDLRCLRILLWS